MNSRLWIKITVLLIALQLAVLGGITVIVDPIFHFHRPIDGLSYDYADERYENCGIVDRFEYDAVITGSSMAENFKCSLFDRLFGVNSVKATFCGSFYIEQTEIIERAYRTHPNIKAVLRPVDPFFFRTKYDKNIDEDKQCPDYLSNGNPFDDVKYIFNADVLLDKTISVLKRTVNGIDPVTFNDNYYGSWRGHDTYGLKKVADTVVPRHTQSPNLAEFTSQEEERCRKTIDYNYVESEVIRIPLFTFFLPRFVSFITMD